jgi:hypothetical protein
MTEIGADESKFAENMGILDRSQVNSTFDTGLGWVFFGAAASLESLLAKESQVGGVFFCPDPALSGSP